MDCKLQVVTRPASEVDQAKALCTEKAGSTRGADRIARDRQGWHERPCAEPAIDPRNGS